MTTKEVYDLDMLISDMSDNELETIKAAAIAEKEIIEKRIKSLEERIKPLEERIAVIDYMILRGE